MEVFEPLATIAAIFAIGVVTAWWRVAKAIERHNGRFDMVSDKLRHAALITAITLVVFLLSLVAVPAVEIAFDLLAS